MPPDGPSNPIPANEDLLDRLLLRAIAAVESGGNSAVAELLQANPAEAQALQRRIDLLRQAGLWNPTSPSVQPDEFPERLGEFRLQRVLGAGGMGVVYLALQEPLGREVALKVVRPEHLFFPGARERFQREVETVARLRHPGIVPVYTVGEHQGLPYFAMEYVQGKSLEAVIAACRTRTPSTLQGRDLAPSEASAGWLFAGSWEAACLRVIRQIAEALQHAHERGVLHRDIKPSNIMLAADGSSRAMLLDFGLASNSNDSTLTRTGSRLGSLAYMSPEQVRGATNSIDARSDVYSLGVTLFELLTLARAFQADSEVEVVRKIQHGSRKSPRELNSALSWEAETVCLTAMDADPARRYGSAADFARDLANVLERRPIEAQRASTWLLARRWIQRRPAVASALALAALLVVVGPSVWIWQASARARDLQTFNTDLGKQLAATQAAQKASAAESERALRAATRAREAIKNFLHKVGNDYLKSVPRADELRTQLLEDAVRLHEEMLADDPGNDTARGDFAVSLRALGERYAATGDTQRGDEHLARSLELLNALQLEVPDDLRWMILLGKTLGERAVVRIERGSPDAATEADARRAIELLERCLVLRPDDNEVRHDLAVVQMTLAGLRQYAGDPGQAIELYASAEKSAQIVADRDPTLRKLLLTVLTNSAGALDDANQHERALAAYTRALETAQALLRDEPTTLEVRFAIAAVELNFSSQLAELDRLDEARSHSDEALAHFESLAADFPTQILFTRELGCCLVARWLIDDKSGAGFDETAARAREILESVLARSPEESRARDQLVILLHAEGLCRLKRGEPEAGAELLRQAFLIAVEGAKTLGNESARAELLALLKDVLELRGTGPEPAALAQDLSRELRAMYPEDAEIGDAIDGAGEL